DDVLVFLGRIFCVSDGSVGPEPEPLRMLFEPGMIGRALNCEIECNLQIVVTTGCNEALEISQRSELRMDGIVPALGRADRIETAGVIGPGVELVVASLPVGAADRMDRGKVDDVETKLDNFRQSRDAIVKRSVFAGPTALAAWNHFIPGSGTR